MVLELTNTRHKGRRGQLVIVVEECHWQAVQGEFSACVTARGLRKVRTFSRNWPFFQIEKAAESGASLPVYRSEVLPKCYGGSWRPFVIPLDKLCQGDLAVPITITFWDQKGSNEQVPLGYVQMSLQAFIDRGAEQLTLCSTKGKATMSLTGATLRHKRTFYGYLELGLQLNLITAIDFTISNNEPERPYSLHYTGGDGFNQYQTCIQAVGSIICPYDSDQFFPCYGFGGKIGDRTSHCFPLNQNEANPSVHGLDGIHAVYSASVRAIKLSTPTYFAPVIRKATELAVAASSSRTYSILMIITDGTVLDMQETIAAIVDASRTPISIIIIGVGNEDFSSMVELDGDNGVLRSRNAVAARDIVQFIPFARFQDDKTRLAAEVLAEIPKQIEQYCFEHGL
jgi:hypothetical protein